MAKSGPRGGKHSEETKQRMSEIRKEYYRTHEHFMKGKKHSDEARAKMRKALKAYHDKYGYPKHTPEELKKMSLARRAFLASNGGTWGKHTQESKDHHSKVLKQRYQEDVSYRHKVGEASRQLWQDEKWRTMILERRAVGKEFRLGAACNTDTDGSPPREEAVALKRFIDVFNSLD